MTIKHLIIVLSFALYGCQTDQVFVKADTAPKTSLMDIRNSAITAYQKQDYAVALPLYKTLTAEVSSDPELWFHLGNIYARLQQPNLAVSAYQSTLKLNPKHIKAWHNMGVVQLRLSANTFTQMLQNTAPNDPLYRRAESISIGLLELLGKKPEPQQTPAKNTTQ